MKGMPSSEAYFVISIQHDIYIDIYIHIHHVLIVQYAIVETIASSFNYTLQ